MGNGLGGGESEKLGRWAGGAGHGGWRGCKNLPERLRSGCGKPEAGQPHELVGKENGGA